MKTFSTHRQTRARKIPVENWVNSGKYNNDLNSWYSPLLHTQEICKFTCEQLSDLHICGLPEQPDQSWYASAVLQGYLVVIVGFAVHQVPQGSTGAAVHVGHPVVQQVHQQLDATLSPDLKMQDRGRN